MASHPNSLRESYARSSNPVWLLTTSWDNRDPRGSRQRSAERLARWHEEGISIPGCVIQALVVEGLLPEVGESHGDPKTRVVGLVVDKSDPKTGFVHPLHVDVDLERNRQEVSPNLPFRPEHIQDGLAALLKSSGSVEGVPELFSFKINDQLGIRSDGSSMDIAALLAIVDAIGKQRSPLLRRACAIIEPEKGLDQDSVFRSVGGVTAKLRAFEREYGDTGSLLVRCPTDERADQFDDLFEKIWRIENFEQLVAKLAENGMLEPLFKELAAIDIDAVCHRLQWLKSDERQQEALGFAKRCWQFASRRNTVPLTDRLKIGSELEDLNRHLGKYVDAVESSRKAVEQLRDIGDLVSDEDVIDAEVRLAAAYIEAHQFQEADELLESVVNQIKQDRRRISVALRCRLFNTLARTMVVLNKDGWEDLFRASLEVQQQVEQHHVPHTRNFLIHALLADKRTGDAELELARQEEPIDDYSQTFLSFYRAELARQQGRTWIVENDNNGQLADMKPLHARAFYLQATARQPGRPLADAVRRFDGAAMALKKECPSDSTGNILPVLVEFVRLASAAAQKDTPAWRDALRQLDRLLEEPAADAIQQFYAGVLSGCGDTPDVEQVEAVLARVPYF